MSALPYQKEDFVETLLNIIHKYDVDPDEIELEITESILIDDFSAVTEKMQLLKEYGIRISLDDFGTGNSSLSLALELPFDELKVDMSFIRDIKQKPQNQAMVQSIVDYARRTNTETCIEGIEDKEVSDYIEKFGSTWQQGYYYSKPVPIEQFEEVLREKATEKE